MLKQTDFIQKYNDFLKSHAVKGKCYVDNGEFILEFEGVSAHGMEPDNGKNAGLSWHNLFLKIRQIRLQQPFLILLLNFFIKIQEEKNWVLHSRMIFLEI